MDTGVVEFLETETRDEHTYFGVSSDRDTRSAQVFWSFLTWRHEMGAGILDLRELRTRDGRRYCGAS
jgi:hypothetical protein